MIISLRSWGKALRPIQIDRTRRVVPIAFGDLTWAEGVLFSLRVFSLGLLRTRGLEEQRPCPRVCRLVVPGPPLGVLFGLKSLVIRGVLLRLGRLFAAGKHRFHLLVASHHRCLLRFGSCLALGRRLCLAKMGLALGRCATC